MKVFIINGKPRSGKDTFKNFIVEANKSNINNMEVVSTSIIDYVKDLANYLGWEGGKSDKERKFLADLKNLLDDFNGSPMIKMTNLIEELLVNKSKDYCVMIDMRSPNDIERLKMWCFDNRIPCSTVLVRRSELYDSRAYGNSADDEVFNYPYDIIVENDEGLETLKESAEYFYEKYMED